MSLVTLPGCQMVCDVINQPAVRLLQSILRLLTETMTVVRWNVLTIFVNVMNIKKVNDYTDTITTWPALSTSKSTNDECRKSRLCGLMNYISFCECPDVFMFKVLIRLLVWLIHRQLVFLIKPKAHFWRSTIWLIKYMSLSILFWHFVTAVYTVCKGLEESIE